jgi:ABC-2 type transport system ATP-binding protein
LASSDVALAVDALDVSFGEVQAVAGLSFAVPRGSITALLGPNGAGKSTTIDVLCGFRRPDAGSAQVLGLDPVTDAVALRARVGVMLQQPGLHTGLRPLELLELFAAFYDAPLDPRALLEEVSLAQRAGSNVRTLSGGEQQRLSLAVALVGRPEIVVLDEPTAGIDAEGKRAIRDRVARLRADGVTVLLTTHDLEEAERLADHVVIIDHGHVVASGTPAELTGTGDSNLRFAAPPGLDVATLSAALDVAVVEVTVGEYEVAAPGTPALVARVTAWLADHDITLGDLRAGRQRLEDVYLQLTAEASAAAAAHGASTSSGRARRRDSR